ncbi:hypothetical protein SmJEL517_g05821 [Synchytrium microbalum]|uniref:Seipin n=1 Tax=Synchytrium microbalum TaxID=1806994 RepID=A0A507BTU3_9FUNG|nr:uncharacterized protein SmJEL517_g05821 [Synchytrium microbalum]TPX30671.1 hypothetical protein SmJEL517_g05821 [Synchytrium microbalum]
MENGPRNGDAASTVSSASAPASNSSAVDTLEPYFRQVYQVITSQQTQRALYSTIAFSFLFTIGIAAASVLYMVVYLSYVPQVNHILPVYFQYGNPTEVMQPTALVPLLSDPLSQVSAPMLTAGQHYRLSVQLIAPNSKHNLELGNFMVSIDVYSHNKSLISSSSRPALMTFQSNIINTMSTLLSSVPILLGMAVEAQTINVVLIERLIEDESMPSLMAHLRLSDSRLRIYQAQLILDAHFVGLRYYMYHWSITTGVFFTSLIFMFESLWAFVVWRAVKRILHKVFPAIPSTPEQPSRPPQPPAEDDGRLPDGRIKPRLDNSSTDEETDDLDWIPALRTTSEAHKPQQEQQPARFTPTIAGTNTTGTNGSSTDEEAERKQVVASAAEVSSPPRRGTALPVEPSPAAVSPSSTQQSTTDSTTTTPTRLPLQQRSSSTPRNNYNNRTQDHIVPDQDDDGELVETPAISSPRNRATESITESTGDSIAEDILNAESTPSNNGSNGTEFSLLEEELLNRDDDDSVSVD